jgi:hypothetical protein
MFRAVLMTQWKWNWGILVAFAVAGIMIPLTALVILGGDPVTVTDVRAYLARVQFAGTMYAILAFVSGATLGGNSWCADVRGKYVYAMTLPVPRWHLVLMRFGAGALLLLLVTAAVWLGAVVLTRVVDVPPSLNTYAAALTIRFLLGALLAFAIAFAIQIERRFTPLILGAVLLALVGLASATWYGEAEWIPPAVKGVFQGEGMFGVYGGRWMLIDV